MAHLIDTSNGRANIAYVGQTPWHGLGQKLTPGADLAVWLKEAGLNFTAIKALVQYETDDGLRSSADDAVIYRSDTRAPLGIVGAGYKIVQPSEVVELFRDLTEDHGYQLETAGSLKGGRMVWALARGPGSVIIGGGSFGDRVNDYLLCSTSFDGSRATVTRQTTVRVVCNNTLTLAEQAGGGHRVSHRSTWQADQAKQALNVGRFAQFAEQADRLAATKIEAPALVPVLLQAYHGLTVAKVNEAEAAARNGDKKAQTVVNAVTDTLTRLSGILESAPGQQLATSKGTLWGLVNAVTYDVDHSKPARSQENRLNSAWFGPGDKLKTAVWDAAIRLAA